MKRLLSGAQAEEDLRRLWDIPAGVDEALFENFKCSYYQRPNSPGFVKPLDAITRLGLIVRGGLEDWER